MAKSKKPADLANGTSDKNAPLLPDSDLDGVTGGFIGSYLKVPDIKGPSTRDGHEDEIEIHG